MGHDVPDFLTDSLQFERDTWANGSVKDDPFYRCPPGTGDNELGTALKIQKDIDTSKFLVPPGIALSKIIYQSQSLNGEKVPVSALILWPYNPRRHDDNGLATVAWAHGACGSAAVSAPSNHQGVWHHFLAPYQIALSGYVVVATDYAGLGVSENAEGATILHEAFVPPSQANDVLYSVIAARAVFPDLSKKFVVVGHSLGGGAVWALAQRQEQVQDCLGAIAISPYTSIYNQSANFKALLITGMTPCIEKTFQDFKSAQILTESGREFLELVTSTNAGYASTLAMLRDKEWNLLQPNWRQNKYLRQFTQLTSCGGKALSVPLLVIQGECDPMVSAPAVEKTVKQTAHAADKCPLHFVSLPSVGHNGALTAGQTMWMDWIHHRFQGLELEAGFQKTQLDPVRPSSAYHQHQNWFLQPITQSYQAI